MRSNPRRRTRLSPALQTYLETAVWSSSAWHKMRPGDTNPEPLDRYYSAADFTQASVREAEAEVEEFVELNREALEASGMPEDRWGRDFWLTRNRHGAGFWDGYYGEYGAHLTRAAHAYGEVEVEPASDGKLRFSR